MASLAPRRRRHEQVCQNEEALQEDRRRRLQWTPCKRRL